MSKGLFDGDVTLFAGLNTDNVTKSLDKLKATVKRGFSNILRYGLGVRSMFALIRKLRKALIEGFGNLAQVSEPFNTAVSSMMNALAGLKSSFASAFAPIVQVVAPAITFFINKVAEAVDAVGMLIAALTGQKEYIKYIPAQQDFAESVDKTSKNADKASKSLKDTNKQAKELERTISGFDDVEILHGPDDDNDNSSSSPSTTGSSGKTASAVAGATTLALSETFTNLAKLLKDAWANADFTEVGALVGEKLNTALSAIDWVKIKDTCKKVAKSLATFINGFIETPGLFANIGKTLAEAFNSAVTFLLNFVTTLHWDSLGTAVKDMIVSALSNIEWFKIYTTMRGFGRGLATFLNNLCTPETFEMIGETVAKSLNSVFKLLDSFGKKFDFTNFGNSVAAGVNKAIEKINIDDLTSGINSFITGFVDAAIAFLDKTDWYGFGRKVANLIKGINWKALLLGLGKIIWEALNSAITFFKGFFDTNTISTPFTKALESLSNTISSAASNIDFQGLANGFDKLVKALAPAVEGFGVGFVVFFDLLFKLGIGFLNALGPAMQTIADAINSLPPDVVKAVGIGLGFIAAALVTIALAKGALGVLGGILAPIAKIAAPAKAAALAVGKVAAGGHGAAGLAYALGAKGLAGALLTVLPPLTAFVVTMQALAITVPDTVKELQPLNDAHQTTYDILSSLAQQYGLTEEQVAELAWGMQGAMSNTSDTTKAYARLDQVLADAGIDVNDFKQALASMASSAASQGKDVSTLESYINGVSTTASTASTNTSNLGDTFGIFNGLSLSTPLKIALLKGAIKSLGDSGDISSTSVTDLQDALSAWESDPTTTNLSKVQTAFENAGVSSDDFKSAIVDSMNTMDTTTKSQVTGSVNVLLNAGPDILAATKSSFSNVGAGATQGLADQQDAVADAAGNIMDASFDEMDKRADSHSPSKEAIKRGEYIGEGLKIGLNNRQLEVINAIASLINTIKTKLDEGKPFFTKTGSDWLTNLKSGISQKRLDIITYVRDTIKEILNNVDKYQNDFEHAGRDLISSLNSGITSEQSSLISLASDIISDVYSSFTSLDFWSVGQNIAVGIYNGLSAHSYWLQVLAWNTAIEMYNSACRALDIHSPSKKFMYIGEMVGEGLAGGVESSASNVQTAISGMVESAINEAENQSDSIDFSLGLDAEETGFTSSLTNFSDSVVDSFSALVDTLQNLADNMSFTIPNIAQGKVLPTSNAFVLDRDTTAELSRQISEIPSGITVTELRELLAEMFTQYMNINFQIGDEQIARHANAGNVRLNRRYNPVTG